jgi:pyrroline-5-carboxylate reductase
VGTPIGSIAFVGGGFMGEGMLRGLLAEGLAVAGEVQVAEPVAARRAELSDRFGVVTTEHTGAAVSDAAIVVLAVKPQDFPTAAGQLAGRLRSEQLVISIMAGITVAALRAKLAHEKLVRCMPNTPLGIAQGFTGWTATAAVSEAERRLVETMFTALGGAAFFADEKYLDMVTAVGGSGPGYVMLVVEALIDGAVQIGLRRDVAREMVLQTIAGSVELARQTGQHPAVLRDAVTSPGGTTAAGLQVLERQGVRAAIGDAIVAAYERSRALGG